MKDIAVGMNLTMTPMEKPINGDDNICRVKPVLPRGPSPWPHRWPVHYQLSPRCGGEEKLKKTLANINLICSWWNCCGPAAAQPWPVGFLSLGKSSQTLRHQSANRKLITAQLHPLRVFSTFPKEEEKSITSSKYTLFHGMGKHQQRDLCAKATVFLPTAICLTSEPVLKAS